MNIKKLLKFSEQKLAYSLLMPTFLILLLIGFYPLVQVFYMSFTNSKFAANKQTQFIGLANYKELLSLRIKIVKLSGEDISNIQNSVCKQINNKVKLYNLIGKKITHEEIATLKTQALNKKKYSRAQDKALNYWVSKNLKVSETRFEVANTFKFFNYYIVIGSPRPFFIQSLINTTVFVFISVFFELILGLIIALIINCNFRGRLFLQGILLLPWAIITVVSAKIWDWMLQPNRTGLFNTLLSYLGFSDGNISFLTNDSLALAMMISIDIWKTTSFVALILLAGLQTIPEELYEAAKIDGANKLQQFFRITLPLLKTAIVVVLIFRTLDALKVFDVFQVILGNNPYSLATYNYSVLIMFREMGMASAIGVIIFLLSLIVAFGYFFFLKINLNEVN